MRSQMIEVMMIYRKWFGLYMIFLVLIRIQDQWLDEALAMYDVAESATIEDLPFIQALTF